MFLFIIFFIISTIIYSQLFFPNISQIGQYDESLLILRGFEISDGVLPRLADGPIAPIMYYFIFKILGALNFSKSFTEIFISSCWIMKVVFFCGLQFPIFLITKKLKSKVRILFLSSIFLAPLYSNILQNGSDAMFAIFSALAFSFLWDFLEKKDQANLIYASVFLSLTSLARPEGFVLFFACLLLILYYGKSFVVTLLFPFCLIILLYIVLYINVTGSRDLGFNGRLKYTFSQGEGMAITNIANEDERYIEGMKLSKLYYGLDSRTSVYRAIQNNPEAYLRRIVVVFKQLPKFFLRAYGRVEGSIILLFGIVGTVVLFKQRRFKEFFIIITFLSYVPLYVLIVNREGHFFLPWVSVFILFAVGGEFIISKVNKRFCGNGLLCLSLVMTPLLFEAQKDHIAFKDPGSDALDRELAIEYLSTSRSNSQLVAAIAPRDVKLAGLKVIYLYDTCEESNNSAEGLWACLKDKGASLIYIDKTLRKVSPKLVATILQGKDYFHKIFISNEVSIFSLNERSNLEVVHLD